MGASPGGGGAFQALRMGLRDALHLRALETTAQREEGTSEGLQPCPRHPTSAASYRLPGDPGPLPERPAYPGGAQGLPRKVPIRRGHEGADMEWAKFPPSPGTQLGICVSDHQKLEREARICRLLKHPNIGELWGTSEGCGWSLALLPCLSWWVFWAGRAAALFSGDGGSSDGKGGAFDGLHISQRPAWLGGR